MLPKIITNADANRLMRALKNQFAVFYVSYLQNNTVNKSLSGFED